jgi:hypothetical protein
MANRFWVGGSGTWDNSSTTNWALTSGGAGGNSAPTTGDTVFFDANSGTAATVTVASTAVSAATTIDKSDITLSLSGNVTLVISTNVLTLTSGTITLNNNTLTTGAFVSSNSNARTINFGTGNITLTRNSATILSIATATGIVYSGTPVFNSNYSGATGTRTLRVASTAGGASTTAVTLNVTAGTDIVDVGGHFVNLNYTGYKGAAAASIAARFIYGDLVFDSGMTISGTGATNFSGTSGTQQITSNGITVDHPITQNSPGATLQLQDNLTMGSTRTFTLTAGTLDLTGNSGNWTLSTGLFSSGAVTTRAINFGASGKITLTGNGAAILNIGVFTGLTISGTSLIEATYSGATGTRRMDIGAGGEANAINVSITAGTDIIDLRTTNGSYRNLNFTGFSGSFSLSASLFVFGDLTISSGMTVNSSAAVMTFGKTSGAQQIITNGKTLGFPLTFNGIGGTFAFQDALTQGSTRAFTITNGTVQLKNGVTSTVGAFATSGTNQKFLQSTTPGSQATLSQASGTVDTSYLTIRDINATGGATWNSFVDQSNDDAGNNDGWDFGISPIIGGAEYTYQLRSFTQPRRF